MSKAIKVKTRKTRKNTRKYEMTSIRKTLILKNDEAKNPTKNPTYVTI